MIEQTVIPQIPQGAVERTFQTTLWEDDTQTTRKDLTGATVTVEVRPHPRAPVDERAATVVDAVNGVVSWTSASGDFDYPAGTRLGYRFVVTWGSKRLPQEPTLYADVLGGP